MGKSKINIKYKGNGANRIVTGSSHILEIKVNNKTTNIMLDCGAIQDEKLDVKQAFEANRMNMDMEDMDYVIVSHAHLDHSMNLCQLTRLGYKGNVYMTDTTLQLIEHITSDGINIHEKTTEYLNKIKSKKESEIYPYMDIRSRQNFLDRVKAYGFDTWIILNENIRYKHLHAGHISGASSIYIEVSDGEEVETVYYGADISCDRDIPFTHKANIENLLISHCIVESTYGGQKVSAKTEKEMIKTLKTLIDKTCIENKGILLIPSFAMARSTNLAYYLKKTYKKYPKMKNIPIYMVSPLIKKCHETIGKNALDYDDKWQNEMDLFKWNQIQFITDYKEVVRLGNSKEPCIIIASSGFGTSGVNTYLLPKKVADKNNTICFVGYCGNDTVGRQLISGQLSEMSYNIDGKIFTVGVNANIENISGLSSHACGYEIVDMISTANTNKLKNVIIVHGDLERGELLKEDFENKFKNIDIYIPRKGEEIKL